MVGPCYTVFYEAAGGAIRIADTWGEWRIETYDPAAFVSLAMWLKSYRNVAALIDIYLDYDMSRGMWLGAHQHMDRRLARLKKLLRLLTSGWIDVERTYQGRTFCSVRDLAKPLILRLENVVRALDEYKDEVHRVRDDVHQLVYPYLLSILEALRTPNVELKSSVHGGSLSLEVYLERDGSIGAWLSVERCRRRGMLSISRRLSVDEAIDVAKRIAERKMKRRSARLVHDICYDDVMSILVAT